MTERKDLSSQYIKVSEPEPHVLLVELARNPVNSFHRPFWTEYRRVFETISAEPAIRAVVLASTNPKLFSVGIDFAALDQSWTDKELGRKALQIRADVRDLQDAVVATERCPVPVIVAVHGITYGLSIDIMSACDVRYAAEDTRFSIKEVDAGLAADIGTLARLPKITGNQSIVHELALTARDFTAAEALQIGLISKIVPGSRSQVVGTALELAKVIAQKSPIAVIGTKHVLQHARDHSAQDNLEYVATWSSAMLQTSDITTAVEAAQKKKPPTFANVGKPPTAKL